MSEATMQQANHYVALMARPQGFPSASDFQLRSQILGTLSENEIRVQVHSISIDPAMRGWMNGGKSYIKPVEIGEVMRALGVGQVVASNSKLYAVGDWLSGSFGVQEFWQGDASNPYGNLEKISLDKASIAQHLNCLGMPGMTAYFGLLEVGLAKAGETVLVSAAAGAVGQSVGQIAKQLGCRVVGLAGGPEKCAMVVNEFGFDECIDYKAGALKAQIKTHCPNGVDVFFDNVGGDILDAALTQIATRGRIVICGAISQYNNTHPVLGPTNYMALLVKRARMEGFVVFDYVQRYTEARSQISNWIQAGHFHSKEDSVYGLENFHSALMMLFEGKNKGKLILQICA